MKINVSFEEETDFFVSFDELVVVNIGVNDNTDDNLNVNENLI